MKGGVHLDHMRSLGEVQYVVMRCVVHLTQDVTLLEEILSEWNTYGQLVTRTAFFLVLLWAE